MTSHPTARHIHYGTAEIVVFCVIALFVVWYVVTRLIMMDGPKMCIDAETYLSDLELLKQGHPGVWRTPAYPLLLWGSKSIVSGHLWWMPLYVFQTLLFLISVICFHDVCRRLISNQRTISLVFTALYAVWPPLLYYGQWLLPDFMCVSFGVIYFKSLLDDVTSDSWRQPVYTGLLVIILIAFKPIFIYLIAVTAAWWIWIYRRHRVSATILSVSLSMMVIASGLTLAYRAWNHKANGYNVLTIATVVNDWMNLYLSRGVNPEEIENPELRQAAIVALENSRQYSGIDAPWYFSVQMSTTLPDESMKYLRADKFRHPDNVVRYFFAHLADMAYGELVRNGLDITNAFSRVLLTVPLMFLMIAAWGVVMLFRHGRCGAYTDYQTMVALSVMAMIAINAYGAYGNWDRLLLPSFPEALWLGAVAVRAFLPVKRNESAI